MQVSFKLAGLAQEHDEVIGVGLKIIFFDVEIISTSLLRFF